MQVDQYWAINHIENADNAHQPSKSKGLGQLPANQGSYKDDKNTLFFLEKKKKQYPLT